MSAFGVSELHRLEQVLEDALTEARARRLCLTRELKACRLFDAVRAGTKDEEALKIAALGPDNDDDPFPPDLGMRPPPIPKPILPVHGLAA